jgi:DCN1-like protein 1/2
MLFPENLVFVAGLKVAPGLKRKLPSFQDEEMDCSDALFPDSTRPNHILNSKTSRLLDYRH